MSLAKQGKTLRTLLRPLTLAAAVLVTLLASAGRAGAQQREWAVGVDVLPTPFIVPGVTVSCRLSPSVSLLSDAQVIWLQPQGNVYAMDIVRFGFGARYHFRESGWFTDAAIHAGYYDVQLKVPGHQGEFLSLDFGGGYEWRVSGLWSIVLSATVGPVVTRWREYEPCYDNEVLVFTRAGLRTLVIPTSLKLSAVYHFPGKKR